ncbi:hypothetical protein [Dokdonia sp. Hel_I_53]|uniref:hypothetical protein n=1 Tax=Dokdonia sp. Hel_I_53 TaxID=1566287 RepID=UPI00119B9EF8|nr:hypothetical protein [Dokdonia sp. Hel_I_53]TVZ52203.1 hypothetical protein OD90_1373 [Dokdonia sp. Hel_I_53]
MKKFTFLIVSILTFFSSCTEFSEVESSEDYIEIGVRFPESSSTKRIAIDDYPDFKSFQQEIGDLVCEGVSPQLVIQDDNHSYLVNLINPCTKRYGCGLIREKNVFRIINNKITKAGKNIDIDNIQEVVTFLREDILNEGKNPSLSDRAEKLFYVINYDWEVQVTDQFNVAVLNLIKVHQALGLTHPFKLLIDSVPPPPPPPVN